jgi:hypothetical protein
LLSSTMPRQRGAPPPPGVRPNASTMQMLQQCPARRAGALCTVTLSGVAPLSTVARSWGFGGVFTVGQHGFLQWRTGRCRRADDGRRQGWATGSEVWHEISIPRSSWRGRGSSICCLVCSIFKAKEEPLEDLLELLSNYLSYFCSHVLRTIH